MEKETLKPKKKKKKFIRGNYRQYSKLGLRRKNKQKYRKGKGIDNKMRLKIKGHLRNIEIGYKSEKKDRFKVNGKVAVLVHNLDELKKVGKDEVVVIAKIGNKKRKEIADYAQKHKISLLNLNIEKFNKKLEEIKAKKKKIKSKKQKKLKDKEKKAKEKEEKSKEEEKEKKKKDDKKDLEKKVETKESNDDKKKNKEEKDKK